MRKIYTALSLLFVCGLTQAQNNALVFDGIDDYVDCGNNAALSAANIRTLEGWVKFNSFTGSQEIFSKSIGGYGIEVLLFNSALSVYCMNGTDGSNIQYPLTNLQTGIWYHVAFSWDGATKESMRLYVNGTAVGTRTDFGNLNSAGVSNAAGSFRIGDWADPVERRRFSGSVDEVRVWNINLTAAQIKGGMFGGVSNTATGLVAYYKANETSGTVLNSSATTTGVNGTLINGTARAASPVQYGSNAFHFDGTDDQMVVPANAAYDLSTGTVECWIKPGSMNYNGCFAGNRGAGGTRYSFHINTVQNTIGLYNGTIYNYISYTFTTGQWYHLAFVCNGTSTAVYINGTLAGTVPSAFNTGTTGQPFVTGIAKYNGGDMEPFLGEIDEVRIWNTQRSQAQIQTHKDVSLSGTEAGLVAHFSFNQGNAAGNNAGLVKVLDATANNNHGTIFNAGLSAGTSNFTSHSVTVLPVQLTLFTAARKGPEVLLQWRSATEQNSLRFDVERSADGRVYASIGSVNAAGQATREANYAYADALPQTGTNHYRLKIVDKNGNVAYSAVRTVTFGADRLLRAVATGSSQTLLLLESGSEEAFVVADMNGRTVVKGKLAQGRATVSQLQAGTYVATVTDGTEAQSVKFVVR